MGKCIFKNIPWSRSNGTRKSGKNNNEIPSNLRTEVSMNTCTEIKNLDSHQPRKHALESPDSGILPWQGISLTLLNISIAEATLPSSSSLLIRLLTRTEQLSSVCSIIYNDKHRIYKADYKQLLGWEH